MLRTNLSTRPFYNERAVHLLLALAGILVLTLTAFNAVRIFSLSGQNTELSSRINTDRSEVQRLNAEAQKVRAGINQDELLATATAAAEANKLIDQRTFSWTEFFNRIEETLPPDVMLTAVQPSFEQAEPFVLMTVLGRRSEDIDEFMEKLEATGAFGDVLLSQEAETDEGLQRVLLRSVYSGGARRESDKADADADTPDTAPAGAKPRPGAAQPAKPAPGGDATKTAPARDQPARGAGRTGR